jgi:hypothetical protein
MNGFYCWEISELWKELDRRLAFSFFLPSDYQCAIMERRAFLEVQRFCSPIYCFHRMREKYSSRVRCWNTIMAPVRESAREIRVYKSAHITSDRNPDVRIICATDDTVQELTDLRLRYDDEHESALPHSGGSSSS